MIVDDGIVISMGCTVTLECANNNFELVSFSTKTKLFSSSEAGCLCFAWRLEVDSSCCCDRDRELVSYLGPLGDATERMCGRQANLWGYGTFPAFSLTRT